MTTSTQTTIVAIVDQIIASGAAGAGKQPRIRSGCECLATDVASRVLSPLVPAGLYQWLVRAAHRETPRQYARRVVLCLVARASQAGLPCCLTHESAETIGMAASYGRRMRSAVKVVSGLEREAARREDEQEAAI